MSWRKQELHYDIVKIFVLFLTVFLLLTRCSGETSPVLQETSSAIADVKMGYGSQGYWAFDNAAMPYATQSVTSKTEWASGKVTFKITGLAYSTLPPSADFFLFMAKFKTPNGKEGTFQYNIADLKPRLISQRFDGTCSSFCEHQSMGSVNWNSAETYSFTFTWDASNVNLEVTDSSGSVVQSGSVPTDGEYAGVDWIRAGNGALPPYDGIEGQVYIVNPTLE
jgi:hypothetical protein